MHDLSPTMQDHLIMLIGERPEYAQCGHAQSYQALLRRGLVSLKGELTPTGWQVAKELLAKLPPPPPPLSEKAMRWKAECQAVEDLHDFFWPRRVWASPTAQSRDDLFEMICIVAERSPKHPHLSPTRR